MVLQKIFYVNNIANTFGHLIARQAHKTRVDVAPGPGRSLMKCATLCLLVFMVWKFEILSAAVQI